jgi:hypothetical protein
MTGMSQARVLGPAGRGAQGQGPPSSAAWPHGGGDGGGVRPAQPAGPCPGACQVESGRCGTQVEGAGRRVSVVCVQAVNCRQVFMSKSDGYLVITLHSF